jgi:pimeloyl-ACP methyl ester carboxylesterase
MTELRQSRVNAGDLEFPTLEAGPPDGKLVLCLHGFPDHPRSWRLLLPELGRAGWRAVAPALRGYAPAAQPRNACYQVAAASRDALAIAGALGADRCALVGHDWGGAVVTGAAILGAERVSKVVTLAVPHGTFGPALMTRYDQQKRSWYMFLFQLPLAEMLVAADDFAFIDRLWEDWSPGYELPPDERKALKETLAAPGVLTAALGYYRATLSGQNADPALADDTAAINGPVPVPALHLHGADDGCIAADICEGMEAFFPAGLRKRIVEGAGHFLQLERPDVVNPEILDFLGAP